MNELTNPVIRFRHAAAAAGITKKTLRNWLDREQVFFGQYQKPSGGILLPERRFIAPELPNRGWQTFDLQELAILALTAELVNYGINPRIAFITAYNEVVRSTYLLAQYKSAPRKALIPAFGGKRILVHRSNDATRFHSVDETEELPAYWPATSMLIVNLQPVIELMLERLDYALEGDEQDD